ncbi:MAG: ABC transporter ATP-binding protein, partial [Bdellovibrionota bacterium]
YAPFYNKISALFVLGWLGRLALLSNAKWMGDWVDSIEDRSLLARIFFFTLAGFFLTAVYRIGFARTSSRAISRLYDEATLRTSRFPMAFFDATPVGRIVTRFSSDYSNLIRIAGGPLAEFFNILFDISICLVMIGHASLWYLPGCLAVAVLNMAVYRLNLGKLRKERREVSAIRSPAIAHFAETTQGGRTIRAFERQEIFSQRFLGLDWNFQRQKLRTIRAILGFSVQMAVSNGLLLLFTGLVGHRLIVTGQTTVGALGAAFAFVVLIGTNLQMFFDYFSQLEDALTSAERLDEYLRKPIEAGQKLPATAEFDVGQPRYPPKQMQAIALTAADQALCAKRSASVEVVDVSFRYRENLPWVLKNVSFDVPAGSKLGVIGKTGSGKSSLIQVLFRLYSLDRGTVRINGVSAEQADLNRYRRAIALISQDPTLFQGTLRDNLDMPGDLPDAQLVAALDHVGLKKWFDRQGAGLASPVYERGLNFSQGERQLLCMARCLLQNAPVVVLDEATSSVDPQSEEIMVRATREIFADRTQIIVAHRLSTLKSCDRILKLENGEVNYFGTARADLVSLL